MIGFSEFNARAALCRQLAELEPASKNLWLAEAERWSCLNQRRGCGSEVIARGLRPLFAEGRSWTPIRRARSFPDRLTQL